MDRGLARARQPKIVLLVVDIKEEIQWLEDCCAQLHMGLCRARDIWQSPSTVDAFVGGRQSATRALDEDGYSRQGRPLLLGAFGHAIPVRLTLQE